MSAKIEAFLARKEIRDIFDLEFLLKKGVVLEANAEVSGRMLKEIAALTKKDYSVKLGSLLEDKERKYYVTENFKILKSALVERMAVVI